MAGFRRAGLDEAALPSTRDADALLRRFDADQMSALRAQQGQGVVEDAVAAPGDPQCTGPPLWAACEALAARSGAVMLGICAPSAAVGVATLKGWVSGLGLPRGLLHGMDVDGKPVELQGAVFIKYNSASGNANVSGYLGGQRGVLFSPQLPDGEFRQFGYLPLGLPSSAGDAGA